MKKNIGIFLMLFLVVGCRTKNLSCTKTIIDSDEVKVEEKISLNFKNKKLDKTFYNLDYYYANNVEANAKIAQTSLEEQFSSYKDSKAIEYFFNNTSQGIHFEIQINPDKVTDEEKETFDKQVNYKDYSDAKEKLAKDGYHCK